VRAAVFLDRDGVINRAFVRAGKPYPPDTLEQFELLPGAAQAMRSLREAGFLVIVVTNQPDVATGKQSRDVVEAMHRQLRDAGLCDDILACFHTQADHCDCRKPRPGMLLEAARIWQIDLTASYMVGDRWRDVDAGNAAGCTSIFIDHGYTEPQPIHTERRAESLADALRWITGKHHG
jgi:D-glycero-D-manno-heptose 1,7-bisphosphate phosphatase